MKIKIAIIATLIATSGMNIFGQGYVTFNGSTSSLWNEFTTPGLGVRGNANINVAFLWAPVGTADLLPAVGSQFSTRGGAAVNQVATNGVDSIATGLSSLQAMLSGGWQFASNGTSLASITIGSAANFSYGQFQLAGSSAGTAYSIVVIGWDSASGLTAILNGSIAAIGWSNPFNYTTGASTLDPNGQTLFTGAGMNQFGVAPVPEPTTLALAGLGAASMLIFRRRKQ
jgi:hypothetical protein